MRRILTWLAGASAIGIAATLGLREGLVEYRFRERLVREPKHLLEVIEDTSALRAAERRAVRWFLETPAAKETLVEEIVSLAKRLSGTNLVDHLDLDSGGFGFVFVSGDGVLRVATYLPDMTKRLGGFGVPAGRSAARLRTLHAALDSANATDIEVESLPSLELSVMTPRDVLDRFAIPRDLPDLAEADSVIVVRGVAKKAPGLAAPGGSRGSTGRRQTSVLRLPAND